MCDFDEYAGVTYTDLMCVLGDRPESDQKWQRLNRCQAWHTDLRPSDDGRNLIWLKSYNTVVAVCDLDLCVVWDFSRAVYGYTATTTQHIHKFRRLIKEVLYLDLAIVRIDEY